MPIKLTAREYRIIVAVIVVAGISLAIGMKYFWRAFPEASIDFRVTRNDSEPLAEQYLAERGFRLQGYRHAAIFGYDDEAKVYLERTQGLERMTALTRGPIRLWRWTHRWFISQQKEEFRADVTPTGEIVGFDHEIEEEAPGANLEAHAARSLAENFLRGVMKRNLNDLEFVESETIKRPKRTDHSYTWKQKSVNLGEGSLRVEVEVGGDQIVAYHEFVKVPDQWSRDYKTLRSRNDSAQSVDQLFMFLLIVTMLIILVLRIRDRDIPVRMALGFAFVGFALYFLGQLNNFSLENFGYSTTDPYSSFLTRYFLQSLLAALGVGTFIFFLVASSEPIYREAYPGLQAFRRTFSWKGLRSRSFFIANVVGIGLTFFFFAYQTVFYLVANKLGAWAPAEVNYSDLLNTRIPWVWVLFIGFLPSVFEEMMFRAFAIAFLKRLLRSLPLAIVLAAFIWGFGHAAYPNQPFFIRGLEVGLGGVVIGIMMLRFGIVATMIWHYSVDALYTAFLLLRSHNHYLMASGGITAGIMLVPLGLALIAYLKTGTFSEEESLTNASEGVSRIQRVSAARQAAVTLQYQPLTNARLALAGGLVVVFIAISMIPVYQFGEGIELKTTREDAYRMADRFLSARQVNPASYHRVATLSENVAGLAVRYLLERRSVKDADQIYRQATKLLLWDVRYFRPLEKEEHHVLVDADGGRVFNYQHELGEDTPGASLSMDEARSIAEKTVQQEGYPLSGFDLQDSQGEKKRAREDYTFVWQAKPGDPRNVGDAHYRLRVDIAGAQVVGFSRFFKLPDDWVRKREARTLSTIILGAPFMILVVGLVSGTIIILVKQIKSEKIEWRTAAKVGAALSVIILLTELNALSTVEKSYETSRPFNLFRLLVGVGFLIVPVLAGLAAWLLVGLATSLYPNAWQIFKGKARRIWRRDAAVAIIVSLSAGAGLGQISALVADHFHAYVPVDIAILPGSFDSTWPAATVFLGGLSACIFRTAVVALIIYIVQTGVARRGWWLAVAGIVFLMSLWPSNAHSVREFLLGWGLGVLTAIVAIGILAIFYRDNILAYVGAGFLLTTLTPMVSLLGLPPLFFVGNGIVLALLILTIMGWMISGRQDISAAPSTNETVEAKGPLSPDNPNADGFTGTQ
jgi:membrane protease YdiL (CAAX protease family)